jgi:hypothetical protein
VFPADVQSVGCETRGPQSNRNGGRRIFLFVLHLRDAGVKIAKLIGEIAHDLRTRGAFERF